MTRQLDILISVLALLVLTPLLLVIALVLRLTGEGHVFYRQQRIGAGGRPFGLWKFATMLKNSPHLGNGVLTLKNDPRILPFGRFLRKTKLNELPQLLNVLVGDMSLIGPRPQAGPHFDVFPTHVKERLKTVRPGLSGIGSIVFRDEEDLLDRAPDKQHFYAHVIAPYKGEVELWYIDRQSVGLYLALLGLTAWVVLVPSSSIPFRIFPDLPRPPFDLAPA